MIYTKYRLAPHHDIHPQSSVARIALATWRAVALVLTMALVFTSPCRAAAQPLSGTITDALGRPLAGVNVELRNENGRTVAHAVTEHAGHFTMGPANPGIYSLDAGKPGFKSAIKIVQLPRNSAEQISIALDAETALSLPIRATMIHAPNGVSITGANKYTMTAQDIIEPAQGENATMADVLTQMPGVALDQNQQIHIRNTEGPQFQYEINGVMVPFDINTNPPFISMINPMFIKSISLLDGILPSRYSYATGGVLNIETKDGCEAPGGSVSIYGGQRDTIQPSFSSMAAATANSATTCSGLYNRSNSAFSSATPAPDAIHDHTDQGQGFGYFAYDLNPTTRLSLVTRYRRVTTSYLTNPISRPRSR